MSHLFLRRTLYYLHGFWYPTSYIWKIARKTYLIIVFGGILWPLQAALGVTYIALGDSYSSGEGAGSYTAESNRGEKINRCHRSTLAWSTANPGGRPELSAPGLLDVIVNRTLLACSGAVTASVIGPCDPTNPNADLQSCNMAAPDDIPQINRPEMLQITTQVDIDRMISITIGGNDIFFGPVLKTCALSFFSDCPDQTFPGDTRTVRQLADDALAALPAKLKAVYTQLKTISNNTPIFVLGYPVIFPTGSFFSSFFCFNAALFSTGERQFFAETANKLTRILAHSAAQEGVHFVDVTGAFVGHEVCGVGDDWIRAYNPGDAFESYHPNVPGQAAYAKVLRDYIAFKGQGAIPPNPAPIQSAFPLNLKKSSGIPLPSMGDLVVEPAQPLNFDHRNSYIPGQSIRISGTRFSAGALVTVQLFADTPIELGQFTAAAGVLETTITLPSNVPTNLPVETPILLVAYGTGANGANRFLSAGIRIVATVDEIDDYCPTVTTDGVEAKNNTDTDTETCEACGNEENADEHNADYDQDGLCSAVDPCPFNADNRVDENGVCLEELECLANHLRQPDCDQDGIPNHIERTLSANHQTFKDNDIFANARLFVMQQYRDVLWREGDTRGIDFWATQLNENTTTRAQLIKSHLESAEFDTAIAPIVRLYFAYFNRLPDLAGLSYWVNAFKNGQRLTSISQSFATSDEFLTTYGVLNHAEFVRQVYLNVLGWQPDSAGLDYWTAQLTQNNLSRGELLVAFAESGDYKNPLAIGNDIMVTLLYVSMLKRTPENEEFTFWVNQMDQGASPLELIESFLETDDYFSRFLPSWLRTL